MLNAAIIFHLQQHPSPVSTSILERLYIDNVASGCNTEQEAINYFSQSQTLIGISSVTYAPGHLTAYFYLT